MKQFVKRPSKNFSSFKAMLVLLLLATFTYAQTEDNSGKKLYGGFGHLNFSGEQLNLNDLNRSLSANGYGTINLNNLSFGGGGFYSIHNFLIGGGGAWLMNSSTQNQVNSVNLKGGYGHFSFGYIVYSGKRSLLYPSLGIGGGSYSILVGKKNPQGDFSQQLNAPNGMIAAEAGGWMTNLQLTYQHFFTKTGTEGFFIGLKAGYKYSPYNWNVTMNNTTLSNSPKINMNGFYVTLILGGGSIFKN